MLWLMEVLHVVRVSIYALYSDDGILSLFLVIVAEKKRLYLRWLNGCYADLPEKLCSNPIIVMKKIILIVASVVLFVGAAFASSSFKTMNNFDNKTTVVVEVDSVGSDHLVQDVVFHNDGKAYECKELKTTQVNDVLTITAGFKKFKMFKNCYLTFMLNGRIQKVCVLPVEPCDCHCKRI